MGSRDLRQSIARKGQLMPGLFYAGELVDGRKRREICAALGVSFATIEARTLHEACALLWESHPLRAVELAGGAERPLLELADLCGVTATAMAKCIAKLRAKPRGGRQPRLIREDYKKLKGKRVALVRRLFVMEPELYAYAREAAAQLGHNNFSRLVREALWAKVALIVPAAPLHPPKRLDGKQAIGARNPKRRRKVA